MNSVLAEAMAQVGFVWWDDAVTHARWLARESGRRRRVVWDARRDLWIVRPSLVRCPR